MYRGTATSLVAVVLILGFLGAGAAHAEPIDDSAGVGVAAEDTDSGLLTPTDNTIVKRSVAVDEGTGSVGADDPDGIVSGGAGSWVKATGRRYLGEQCGTSKIGSTSGHGATTLTLSVKKSVATKWSATAAITTGAVSAGMGFDVTKTYEVTDQSAYPVPKKKFGVIEAYPLYDVYGFNEISRADGRKIGTGKVTKPVGVCFNQWLS